MDRNKDAFGQAMWACYGGGKCQYCVERDDGYIDVSKIDYFAEYRDWPDQQKKAIKLAKGRVLDIGSGAGRHSLYLQKKGLDVTGLDISPLALKVSRLRGLKKTKHLSITEINKFQPNSFDTILMLGNNFGLLENFNKARRLLKTLYKITSPNVLIIAESANVYKTNNPFHWQYHKLNRKRGRMPGQLKLRIRFEKFTSDWFDYLLVSKKEMREILKGTGWRVKKFIDSKKAQYIAIIEKI